MQQLYLQVPVNVPAVAMSKRDHVLQAVALQLPCPGNGCRVMQPVALLLSGLCLGCLSIDIALVHTPVLLHRRSVHT